MSVASPNQTKIDVTIFFVTAVTAHNWERKISLMSTRSGVKRALIRKRHFPSTASPHSTHCTVGKIATNWRIKTLYTTCFMIKRSKHRPDRISTVTRMQKLKCPVCKCDVDGTMDLFLSRCL